MLSVALHHKTVSRCCVGIASLCTLLACSPSLRVADAARMPLLQLAPAALAKDLALQQRLRFIRHAGEQQIDALLEVDAEQVRLLLHQSGQSAMRIYWDGSVLEESRADWLPAELNAARVLSDLQLSYWPASSVRAALPEGWRLQVSDAHRALSYRGEPVVTIDFLNAQYTRLTQHRYGYVLEIESVQVTQ